MKQLKLKIENTDYTLELNRNSIKWLEAKGFSLQAFSEKPITCYDLLWTSLFIKNHADLSEQVTLELEEKYANEKGDASVTEVVRFAAQEYQAFMNALAGINSKKNEKDENLKIIEN